MSRVSVQLYDKTRDQLFDLGRYNMADSTMLQVLTRAYKKKHLDKICECVPDYQLVVGTLRVEMQTLREVMMQ